MKSADSQEVTQNLEIYKSIYKLQYEVEPILKYSMSHRFQKFSLFP